MFQDDELLMISGLQHLAFCERQCALIHIDEVWAENRFTAEGRALHEKAHEPKSEYRRGVRTARALRLCNRQLGLTGVADVVEFHRIDMDDLEEDRAPAPAPDRFFDPEDASDLADGDEDIFGELFSEEDHTGPPGAELEDAFVPVCDTPCPPRRLVAEPANDERPGPAAIRLKGARGWWRVFPVEYKRGSAKPDERDAVQLCAQALCLEEMLDCAIAEGAIFYGQSRKRQAVALDETLRQTTGDLIIRLRALMAAGSLPPPTTDRKRCAGCSLFDHCMPDSPKQPGKVARYLRKSLDAILKEEEL